MNPSSDNVIYQQYGSLKALGPYLTVEVQNATLIQPRRSKTLSLPDPFFVKALVDTGARRTLVNDLVWNKLGLKGHGNERVSGVDGKSISIPISDIRVVLPPGKRIDVQAGMLSKLGSSDWDCIIGRDVLEHVVLLYDGPANTILCWQRPTDPT